MRSAAVLSSLPRTGILVAQSANDRPDTKQTCELVGGKRIEWISVGVKSAFRAASASS